MNILKIILSYINWVDIFVVICLIRSSYIGLTRGFSAEILRFLSVVAIIVLTYHFYGRLGHFLSENTLLQPAAAKNAGFVILVIGLSIFFKIVCVFLRIIIKISGPEGFEKVAGFILGVIRGFMLTSLILTTLQFTNVTYFKKSTYGESFIGGKVAQIAPKTYNYFLNITKL